MKLKLFSFFLIVSFVFFIISCGGGKYADLNDAMDSYIAATSGLVSDAEKVTNAKEAADALNNYADRLEEVAPKIKAMLDKYPELKTMKKEDLDPELVKINQKMADYMKKMTPAMMKLMKYMNDPEVQKAQKRIGEISRKMR